MALQYNPQSTEVSRKIKKLGQLQKEKQRAQELEYLRSNVDMAKHLESFKAEMVSPVFFHQVQFQRICINLSRCLYFDWSNSDSETNCLHMNELLQSDAYGTEDCWKEVFSFIVETMETAVMSWHETSKVETRVYFLLDKETQTDKYAPAVNIDKVLKA